MRRQRPHRFSHFETVGLGLLAIAILALQAILAGLLAKTLGKLVRQAAGS